MIKNYPNVMGMNGSSVSSVLQKERGGAICGSTIFKGDGGESISIIQRKGDMLLYSSLKEERVVGSTNP